LLPLDIEAYSITSKRIRSPCRRTVRPDGFGGLEINRKAAHGGGNFCVFQAARRRPEQADQVIEMVSRPIGEGHE
jgi:hypothetical protein